ncbi:MAG TPA: glycosyltransferase family 2 protein [Solirubrobacteraceae bacterium]
MSERLLALLACRDEMRHLPGFLRNVGPQVDAIVALDDGSTDGSAELLDAAPEVLEVLRVAADRPAWDEMGNFRRLVDAALRHGATWAMSVDADERLERGFRERAERIIASGEHAAYAVRMRELWGSREAFRCDGLWGGKAPPRLFAVAPGQTFSDAELHAPKVPLGVSVGRADLEVYHLRMIAADDRRARRERYERLDPTARWQPRQGYAYLTDERGLELCAVDPDRGFVD